MINTFIGDLGHLFVVASFITAIVAAISYAITTQQLSLANHSTIAWRNFSRFSFYIHTLSTWGVILVLFYIIYNHLFEYHYAWSHSSRNLPVYYMISCFWEGQEGSFLLWIFWHTCLGLILIHTNKTWEAPLMTIFALVQAFLVSMILGIVLGDAKIGSSPFILLRDAMEAPIFQTNPNFTPEDGRGLNPLLQNYWMVIHPPTLFLGFALTLVPFAYVLAGMWQKKYKEWVRPALPWALVGAAILGIGIMMGGVWAYETLNFGGYWNWDPVENAVYVPWLVLVAAIHTMVAHKKSETTLKAAIILNVATFLLILYSTFLTRSGVLGNASVHSFTDLGLSGQLLLYMLFFSIMAILLLIIRWKSLPKIQENSNSAYSREFWILIGAITLCLAGFQVLATTSIPVYNAIAQWFGYLLDIAPPANQIEHYTKFQIWFAVLVAILSGTGQYFWWNKMDKKVLFNTLSTPLVVSLLFSALLIALGGIQNIAFIVLLTTSIYSIIANLQIFISIVRNSGIYLAGGSVTHIGIAMMFLGILFSAGYSKVVSVNTSGLLYSKEFSTEMNQENVLLWLNKPIKMENYTVTYKGDCIETNQYPYYIQKKNIFPTNNPYKALVIADVEKEGKVYFKRGDTLHTYPENTYYEVEYQTESGQKFVLYPRAQVNPQMGLLASPDIKKFWGKDLYTHVSSIPDPTAEKEWSEAEEKTIQLGDTLFLNDYVAIFKKINPIKADKLIQLSAQDAAMEAEILVLAEGGKQYTIKPKFYVKDNMIGFEPDVIKEIGLRMALKNIKPEKDPQQTAFTFAINTTQKDYIIMKAMEKPMINVLWLGTGVVMFGFCIAIYRRYREFFKMEDKESKKVSNTQKELA
ncbi:MAG: cytochrome C biogenesis protein [Cytophagales bacterium]|nr:MAG: cytochrome C biogenesis protein [Cytophagales bacterium]